jgi:hypothetical protein
MKCATVVKYSQFVHPKAVEQDQERESKLERI